MSKTTHKNEKQLTQNILQDILYNLQAIINLLPILPLTDN